MAFSSSVSLCRVNVGTFNNNKLSTLARAAQAHAVFSDGNATQRRINSLLGPNKQFPLPGDVAVSQLNILPFEEKHVQPAKQEKTPVSDYKTVSIDEVFNNFKVRKAAHYEPAPVIDKLKSDVNVELKANNCPRLLKRELKSLFPGLELASKQITVLNLTQKSDSDMSVWSEGMEDERMKLTASFIESATEICNALAQDGYWANFIDPSSGRPYLGEYTNSTLFEMDERYRQLGFQIEDLGCCLVIKHMLWGTHAFVGTIFTDASLDSEFVRDVLKSVNSDEKTD